MISAFVIAFCFIVVGPELGGLAGAAPPTTERPAGCDQIDPLSKQADINDLERDAVKISRDFHNRTALGVAWSLKTEDVSDLCGFVVHWYQSGHEKEGKQYVLKEPGTTSHLITGLLPGTRYYMYIITYYTTQHKPQSWLLTTTTDGCGPDSLPCNSRGTARCDDATGDCICKTNLTTGANCDQCPLGYYLHSFGCVTCDHCPNDQVSSDGTCKPAKDPSDTMECNCFYPYIGKHCTECAKDFYWKDEMGCVPCKCNRRREEDKGLSCDPVTGKCECGVGVAGDMCEKCADGYIGDAMTEGCAHLSHAGVKALVVIVIIIAVGIFIVTFYLICRRRCRERLSRGIWKVHLREDYDKVNFTTLEEEPDFDATKPRA